MRYILILMLSGTFFSCQAQMMQFTGKAQVYLVRHAEKLSGQDPLLTKDGNKRAGDLMRTLQQKKIRRIYVTEYKRTQGTADSLRIQIGIDTVHYLSDTSCTDLFNQIKTHKDLGNTILIIGHSNTIPIIIRKLGIANYPLEYIPDTAFDNLFLVTFKKSKPYVKKMKYGKASGASATMQ
ncbi:MAG: phosphoglycerate mutase family protein [Ferruginibacter sp.]